MVQKTVKPLTNNTPLLPQRFTNLLEFIRFFKDEQTCITYLQGMRWKDGITCPRPRCGSSNVHIYPNHNNRFKCLTCKKVFNAKIGTIFENTKIPMVTWFMAIYMDTSLKNGISSHQLSRDLGVTQKTAWFMLHRIRMAYNQENFDYKLGENNVVEADHKYVGGKERNKHKEKKIPGSQGGKNKMALLGEIERGGYARAYVVNSTNRETTKKILQKDILEDAILCSDEGDAFKGIIKKHYFVKHSDGEYVKKGKRIMIGKRKEKIHSQWVEGALWTAVQYCVISTHRYISRPLAQKYIDGIVYRLNTRNMEVDEKVNLFLEHTGHRLTYKKLTSIKKKALTK